METNLYSCSRSGHMISEKTMEVGNIAGTIDGKSVSASLTSLYGDRTPKLTANGHDSTGEASSPLAESYEQYRPSPDSTQDDTCRKRINPLRIHLGKRPFVDNSPQYYGPIKKKKPNVIKPSASVAPRVPKLIPKYVDRSKFHNVASHPNFVDEDESNKPVPRLVPKSQLLQYKKSKMERSSTIKDSPQNVGMQPMVKFKCRKCCSMSFKTLAMLKEHQLVCRAQVKEPALSPEATVSAETKLSSGPSRVTRKVYLCSACGTYYENWNLFLHMREVHNRHICLFCLGMFSKAEKLSSHLMNKHNVNEFKYDSKEEFFSVYSGTLFLMCCACDEICSEQDDFYNHDCNNVKPKPVPVLVSKNTVKPNSIKPTKLQDISASSSSLTKETPQLAPVKSLNDNINEPRPETVASHSQSAVTDTKEIEPIRNYSNSSEPITKTSLNSSNILTTSVDYTSSTSKLNSRVKTLLPNGDDKLENLNRSKSAMEESIPVQPSGGKEKEGIKLKLSLNNANSPVIINSTVDPTIGRKNANKPPPRARRPPKRYEKLIQSPSASESNVSPRPTIKMTICDKADKPFVKTTIFENNQPTILQTLLNNNQDTPPKPSEGNAIKSTIYDNKIEDLNSLNRVPKLTVRVPKELLDIDSSSDYSSDSEVSDKLTVDENNMTIAETDITKPEPELNMEESVAEQTSDQQDSSKKPEINTVPEENKVPEESIMEKQEIAGPETPIDEKVQISVENTKPNIEPKTEPSEQDVNVDSITEETGTTTADELPVTELTLDKPLDKYALKELLRVFLSTTIYNCIYCNHARKIAVNCEKLSLHIAAEHRFSATVNSITAEELMPDKITAKIKADAEQLSSVYINLESYDSEEKSEETFYDNLFECFQCYFKTAVHKDLYLHNRKMHQKTILLCVMCKSNFYSYSELLCHLCPGAYNSEYEIKFRCCLCNVDTIPSSFRLMVHLRKIHHTCDVCLEYCHNQARLSNHVWKHKLHHLCYRCGIAYRNKPDITNHLFWKHGTESVSCKRCLQKKWPHVYHFCNPPAIFLCEECNLQFSKAVHLKVHKRFHANEFPHVCTEEDCTEKFVSKKLLSKHVDNHRKKLLIENVNDENPPVPKDDSTEAPKTAIPVIDLVNDKPTDEAGLSDMKTEAGPEKQFKKSKKKKMKVKDALLLDVNLPELNLSESDSSDESDSGAPTVSSDKADEEKPVLEKPDEKPTTEEPAVTDVADDKNNIESEPQLPKVEEDKQGDQLADEEKPNEQKVLEIWDNFKKYQEKVEKPKEKSPPLVLIRKHVCESDHDYCLIPTDYNGDDMYSFDKKKGKKSPKKKHNGLSSSSSSSSDSDSSCSCGSNCSCSSSSGSSSSSSSDSDSSDESGNEKKKSKQKKRTSSRRISNGSNVDVMGVSETPILVPEKVEPPVPETDLETDESDTDEEFYDENPQKVANTHYAEKRNQLMMLATVAPSDGGSITGETSRPITPTKEEPKEDTEPKDKPPSSKKKSKKKKKSRSSRKHGPIKINIPKDIIAQTETEAPCSAFAPNKIKISLQSNTVHLPETPSITTPALQTSASSHAFPTYASASADSKRASKRRRVRNKFYGYSSDEESKSQTQTPAVLKPQQPPKLEWRKEDLPSPVTHKKDTKKEIPSTTLSNKFFSYSNSIRLTAPVPDPEPPRILMNTEMESSDSDSSEGGLQIYQPPPIPPPSYLNSGTTSLPYAFQRPAVREAREGESVYCYCRCPYDEVSEMIACDAEGCPIEWFHFECVGIMVPPKGKWYCPECRKNHSLSGYR